MSTAASPDPGPARALLPDLARGTALFGIAVVNVGILAHSSATGYGPSALDASADRLAYFLVLALFTLKSYSLFAMMFGAGFGQQMDAARRRGGGFGGPYGMRLAGLALFGAFNVVAFFTGDILLIYAALGALLWCLRNRAPRSVLRWGIGLYALQVLLLAALAGLVALWQAAAPQEVAEAAGELSALQAQARAGFGAPGFTDVARHRVATWAQDIGPALLLQGAGAMAFMLLGLAAQRSGLLQDVAHPFWQRSRRIGLPLGLALSAAGAAMMLDEAHALSASYLFGLTLLTLGSPAASAGYLGLLALWAQQPPSGLRRTLALAGSATLSAYLLQGLLLSWVFCGYGLGLYGQLGAAACIGIGAAAGALSIAALAAWRARFGRGPLEGLLRRAQPGIRTGSSV